MYLRWDIYGGVFPCGGKFMAGINMADLPKNRHILPATLLQGQTKCFAISTYHFILCFLNKVHPIHLKIIHLYSHHLGLATQWSTLKLGSKPTSVFYFLVNICARNSQEMLM